MKYFSTCFWLCLSLFTVNQLVEREGVFIPYIHSYLDDFLAPGIVLGFALAFQQQFTFRQKDYTFSMGHVAFFVIWYSFLFEILFPYFDARHHSDIMDVAAYSLGVLLFYKTGNLAASKSLLSPTKVFR